MKQGKTTLEQGKVVLWKKPTTKSRITSQWKNWVVCWADGLMENTFKKVIYDKYRLKVLSHRIWLKYNETLSRTFASIDTRKTSVVSNSKTEKLYAYGKSWYVGFNKDKLRTARDSLGETMINLPLLDVN